jgi:hypothetical protein
VQLNANIEKGASYLVPWLTTLGIEDLRKLQLLLFAELAKVMCVLCLRATAAQVDEKTLHHGTTNEEVNRWPDELALTATWNTFCDTS